MDNTYPLPLYLGSRSGAVTLETGARFLIEGNVISGNTAALGAGLTINGPTAGQLYNNLIINNRAYDPTAFGGLGGGLYCLVMTNAVETISVGLSLYRRRDKSGGHSDHRHGRPRATSGR